jgi:protein-S-isoprenylcysteine O-methyltransferase Ste14
MKLKQDHQLITSGLYQWVRHPMYSAFIVLSLSWFMMIGDWFIGGLWLVATALVVITRMNGEKRMMAQEFGEVYQQYKERTGRLFPRF